MEVIIKDLYISEEVKDGLIKEGNIINSILKLAISYGKGNWEEAAEYAKKLNVDMDSIPETYLETLKWTDGVNFE
jgi:EAL and modified HD-GYP domain-containing signal transduction protein